MNLVQDRPGHDVGKFDKIWPTCK